MRLVEQHNLKGKQWKEADSICFLSKNLYNLALYEVRQHFFETNEYLGMGRLDKLLQGTSDYKAMPAKVAQQILIQLDQNFKNFFNALQSWKKNPIKFHSKPRIPGYLDKQNGRNLTIYTAQAISKMAMKKKGIISLSKTSIRVSTKQQNICQARLVPQQTGAIILEVVYEKPTENLQLNKKNRIAIDLGVNNLCAITSDKQGFNPILVKGGAGKAINQFYNKRKAEMQSRLEQGRFTSKAIQKLTQKRNRKVKHLFHQVSKHIIEICKSEDIGIIVIGRNKEWKQEVNIGKKNNQNFVGLPFATLIQQIRYKAKMVGIEVIEVNESYTSKCSALDLESVERHEEYVGKRVKRGLFRSKEGIELNADVNGSMNILRKAFPKAYADGIEAVVVQPLSVIFTA